MDDVMFTTTSLSPDFFKSLVLFSNKMISKRFQGT